MLHVGVLPHHDRWGDALHNLRLVVVDEAHVYRGIFGSHVGNVLRRLRRLALAYDADPVFVLASATIANAGELATRLTAWTSAWSPTTRRRRPSARSCSGTPSCWTPSSGTARARSATRPGCSRASSGAACARSASRRAARRPSSCTASRATGSTRRPRARLAPYRAGYTPEQRREIERRLVEGELLGVTATEALELGIDVGSLDCAISVGFPGTVASLRQQWGRAGRRSSGLAVLVASEDALDQFFVSEPEALLGEPPRLR